MRTRKIINIGNSVGITLPIDLMAILGWKISDRVCFTGDKKKLIIKKVEKIN
jgi:antitoxin component of MazEF toxin-antitoxin module